MSGRLGPALAALRLHGSRCWQWRPQVSVESLLLATCLFFALACNASFWRSALSWSGGGIGFAASLLVLQVAIHAFVLGLLVWRWNAKLLLGALILCAALAAHYMGRYQVYINAEMLRNVLQTDPRESRELVTPALALALLLFVVPPTLALCRIRLRKRSIGRALLIRLGFLCAASVSGLGATLLCFQDLSALIRNHHEIRYLATPINMLAAARSIMKSATSAPRGPKRPLEHDAVATLRTAGTRPRLLVIVLGEAARAQNWGLNGYARQTTPELAKLADLVNFRDVRSCGTSTEVSVPCMFSPLGRHDYDQKTIRSQQSLLHVLEHAGIGTLWRDNQSGCKGVCEQLPTQSLQDAEVPALCRDGRCLDEVLLEDLPAQVRGRAGDRVVVLHQLGNHGPSYFQRYPSTFKRFVPACEDPDLGRCSRQQIVNAYDNALLYTDHFLNRTVSVLQAMDDYDSAMLYVSDHGESLGEKGLYLHGVPYAIAPREQTRVPMVMWFSSAFSVARGLNLTCLQQRAQQPADHDNLFASILGLMQVRTRIYDASRDLFAGCVRR
ncbi:MAG TPA: phosphoethanolamine--lipid A transferase [Stenotrophomonas sp.]